MNLDKIPIYIECEWDVLMHLINAEFPMDKTGLRHKYVVDFLKSTRRGMKNFPDSITGVIMDRETGKGAKFSLVLLDNGTMAIWKDDKIIWGDMTRIITLVTALERLIEEENPSKND